MRFLIGMLLAIASTVAPAASIFDDFNDGNDDGWTRYSPLAPFGAGGTFTFPSGGYRIAAPASPLPNVLGPGRAGSVRLDAGAGDFRASVDLVGWDNTLDQGFGVVARVRELALGTSDGYWLHYVTRSPVLIGTGSLVLDRIDNEVPFLLGEVPITLDAARDYRLVFTGAGPTLTGRLFDIDDLTTPLTTLVASDSAYAFGAVGLLVSDLITGANGPADATFDNFQVSAVPEPGALMLFLAGLVGIPFHRRARRRSVP